MLPPSLLSTKRLIVDVIRFQPGETLTEILETPATSEQVKCRGLAHSMLRFLGAPVTGQRGGGGAQAALGAVSGSRRFLNPEAAVPRARASLARACGMCVCSVWRGGEPGLLPSDLLSITQFECCSVP